MRLNSPCKILAILLTISCSILMTWVIWAPMVGGQILFIPKKTDVLIKSRYFPLKKLLCLSKTQFPASPSCVDPTIKEYPNFTNRQGVFDTYLVSHPPKTSQICQQRIFPPKQKSYTHKNKKNEGELNSNKIWLSWKTCRQMLTELADMESRPLSWQCEILPPGWALESCRDWRLRTVARGQPSWDFISIYPPF